MRRRYLYVLWFSVPALLAGALGAFALFGAAAGALWIFVFGDNPWPASAEWILATVFVCAGAAISLALMGVAYAAGKRQEGAPPAANAWPLAASAGITVALVAIIALHQWRVGNLGAKSPGLSCAQFCQGKGFSGAGMPPRDSGEATCSCYDAQGREALKVPMTETESR